MQMMELVFCPGFINVVCYSVFPTKSTVSTQCQVSSDSAYKLKTHMSIYLLIYTIYDIYIYI